MKKLLLLFMLTCFWFLSYTQVGYPKSWECIEVSYNTDTGKVKDIQCHPTEFSDTVMLRIQGSILITTNKKIKDPEIIKCMVSFVPDSLLNQNALKPYKKKALKTFKKINLMNKDIKYDDDRRIAVWTGFRVVKKDFIKE